MEETLKRLGKIETGETPGKSAYVKPYTITYEMVIAQPSLLLPAGNEKRQSIVIKLM